MADINAKVRESLTTQYKALIQDTLDQFKTSFTGDVSTIATYAAARTQYLSTIVGDPNFAAAVVSERDAIGLFVSVLAVAMADETDRELLNVLQGALTIGASALAAAVAA